MRRVSLLLGLLAGCGRFVEDSPALSPPPTVDTTVERGDPGGFDPCPEIAVEPARQLSTSAAGTSDPRIAWNQDLRQFMVVWREEDTIVYRRLDPSGAPIGLERTLRGPAGAAVTGDPAVLASPGLQASPFFVTVQAGGVIGVDRILDDDQVPPDGEWLGGALPTNDAVRREERIPAFATDGERIALGYRTDVPETALVSLKLGSTGAQCLHAEEGTTPVICDDNARLVAGAAAIGWLPPAPAEPNATLDEDATGTTVPSWWMIVRSGTALQWVTLDPPARAFAPLEANYPRTSLGTEDFRAGPRVTSGSRRLAVALRRDKDPGDDEPGVTEAWQMTDDGMLACVVATSDLSAGTPAVAWAHGRRLAVVGLTQRSSGATDVVVARADAPFTEQDRRLAMQQGRVCPQPMDVVEVTSGAHARDPDVAFSGEALGVVWAQEDDVADVWFARARCVAP